MALKISLNSVDLFIIQLFTLATDDLSSLR